MRRGLPNARGTLDRAAKTTSFMGTARCGFFRVSIACDLGLDTGANVIPIPGIKTIPSIQALC
ncbi:hypothetical protein ASNO1_04120 [Corallococcus caeni]|uniref:Uncharacterized protein n=1 Tax=Corallococcus caeni TaxID=3082388 RepID=A0ABQ6QJF1_9BACT|nr:hypothetical protein ASNO1_04120 [Corallococcus sp. NO1]